MERKNTRINEKILEYYMKFGKERDLEKFMRLYSPESACSCGGGGDNLEEEIINLRCLFNESSLCLQELQDQDKRISQSMPNMDYELSDTTNKNNKNAPEEHIIPIILDYYEDNNRATSEENININPRTPTHQMKHLEAKTPESIAKTNRRLEWDSLGDIGYKKSISTGNISVLERTLLRELFQESFEESSINASNKTTTNSSASEIKTTVDEGPTCKRKIVTIKTRERGPGALEANKRGIPLASSTLVLECERYDIKNRELPKKLPTIFAEEKSVQTSLRGSSVTSMQSQEVQVSLASSKHRRGPPSVLGSSTSNTSFDYHSSHSSRSYDRSSNTSTSGYDLHSKAKASVSSRNKQQETESKKHPFVENIKQILAQRRISTENQNKENKESNSKHTYDSVREEAKLKDLHDTLKSMLDAEENKENSGATSSNLSNSPQLDLGIQLLCALIEAKSLDRTRKKRLVRDIVKRISHLAACSEMNTITSSSSQRSRISGTENISKNLSKDDVKHSNKTERASRNDESVKSSISNKLSDALSNGSKLALAGSANESRNRFLYPIPTETTITDNEDEGRNVKNIEEVKQLEEHGTKKKSSSSSSSIKKSSPSKVHEKLRTEKETLKPQESKTIVSPIKGDATTTSTSSPTSSRDIVTQKQLFSGRNKNNSNDTYPEDEATMHEWLNPMTQSEIEYEEKKKESRTNSKSKSHKKKSNNKPGDAAARQVSLDWVAKEIERLQNLKYLLLNDEQSNATTTATSSDPESQENKLPKKEKIVSSPTKKVDNSKKRTEPKKQEEKLYDTVYTENDKSSALESTEQSVQEIEVIIDENNAHDQDHEKRYTDKEHQSRNRKMSKEQATQSLEDVNIQKKSSKKTHSQGDLPFFTSNEMTRKRFESHSHKTDGRFEKQQQQQRSKIDTPIESCGESVSVCSFVQQRKREFLEHYRNVKLHHYELLTKQEKEGMEQLSQVQKELQNRFFLRDERCVHPSDLGGGGDAPHYSVPNTLNRCVHGTYLFSGNERDPHQHVHYRDQVQYLQAEKIATAQQPFVSQSAPISRRMEAASKYAERKKSNQGGGDSLDSVGHQYQSHSGQSCCLSSEISVPMGSRLANSTPTTTHQYDDVAAMGDAAMNLRTKRVAGVQTGDSLKRTQPIYEMRAQEQVLHTWTPVPPGGGEMKAACIQVRPKGVAYILAYNPKKNEEPEDQEHATEVVIGMQATLREHLEYAKPEFCAQYKKRKALLNQIQTLRQERERKIREIVDNTSIRSLERKLDNLTPPPTKQFRVFPSKQMKAMTNKRVAFLPEVVAKRQQDREKKRRRSYRLIRDIFNRRLQQRVRKGQLSLNDSEVII